MTAPGKVFILGEYAVLRDRPAVVAALEPRFGLRAASSGAPSEASWSRIHPNSPAGRLLSLARARGHELPELDFQDPYRGAGGFGASTAQFALVYRELARKEGFGATALEARALYRELMADETLPPSGADLVAQWSGGVVRFDPAQERIDSCSDLLDWRDLLVFSATHQPGRKVATHEHLRLLGETGFRADGEWEFAERLIGIAEEPLRSAGDASAWGRALSLYAEALSQAGLEAASAREDRLALTGLPGVLGAKGAGAMLADAVIVLVEPGSPHREPVIRAAESRGLRLVADGIRTTPGVL